MRLITTSSDFWQWLDELGASWQHYFQTEHDWAVGMTFAAFTFVNSARIFAYIPQILKAERDTSEPLAISCSSWGLFLLSHLTTVSYSIICLGNLVMALIFLGNAFACVLVIVAALLSHRGLLNLTGNTSQTSNLSKNDLPNASAGSASVPQNHLFVTRGKLFMTPEELQTRERRQSERRQQFLRAK